MGQWDSLAIPEHQLPTGEAKGAAAELQDGANSQLSDVTGSEEMMGNYIPKSPILFPHLLPLHLTCYQVAACTEWNLLSPLSPPFPGS